MSTRQTADWRGTIGTAAFVLSFAFGLWRPVAFGQDTVSETGPATSAVPEVSTTSAEPRPLFNESDEIPWDQDGGDDSEPSLSEDTDEGGGGLVAFFQTLISLGIVLVGICLLVWMLKKFVIGTPVLLDKRVGRVVGRIYLSPKNIVYLVRLADRVLVIGASTASLTCLAEITDPAVVEEISTDAETFTDTLDRANRSMSAESGSVPPRENMDGHMEDIESQISRLRALGEHESETK